MTVESAGPLRRRQLRARLCRNMRIDPRGRVRFLVVVAIGALFLPRPFVIAALIAALATLWIAVGLGSRLLARQSVKFAGFAVFVIVMYAVTGDDALTDQWLRIGFAHLGFWLNTAGALTG